MRHSFGGFIFGLLLFTAPLISASDVPVTWDTSQCPTGRPLPVTLTLRADADPSDIHIFQATANAPAPLQMALAGLPSRDYSGTALTDGTFVSSFLRVRGDTGAPPAPVPGQLASLTVTPTSVVEGQTAQLTPKDAAGAVLTGLTWSFDPDFIGAISPSGLVTGATLALVPASTPSRITALKGTFGTVTLTANLTITRASVPTPTPTVTPPAPTPTPPPVDLTPVLAGLAALSGRLDQLIASHQTSQPPTANCTFTTVNTASVYIRCTRVDFPTVAVGGAIKVVK